MQQKFRLWKDFFPLFGKSKKMSHHIFKYDFTIDQYCATYYVLCFIDTSCSLTLFCKFHNVLICKIRPFYCQPPSFHPYSKHKLFYLEAWVEVLSLIVFVPRCLIMLYGNACRVTQPHIDQYITMAIYWAVIIRDVHDCSNIPSAIIIRKLKMLFEKSGFYKNKKLSPQD